MKSLRSWLTHKVIPGVTGIVRGGLVDTYIEVS